MSSNHSYLSNADPAYIDAMYEQYQQDPESVDYGWQKFFEGFDFARANYDELPASGGGDVREIYVLNLINGYRTRGHLFTRSNPVRERRKYSPTLDLKNYGLSDADLDTVFQAGVEVGLGPAKLRDIVALLEQTYCQAIGVEYMYIRELEIRDWLRERLESTRNTTEYTLEEKKHFLNKLTHAVVFESFLGTKYVGQKRFSIEGAETLIPALDEIIQRGADHGIKEFVMGMAHRGRLNVLVNTLQKSYSDVFSEFEEVFNESGDFLGDVKYHHGYTCDVETSKGKKVHLSLCPNPSHLESVGPVAQGKTRAQMDNKYGGDHNSVATILIHGDAAIAAQGVVYELVQMSELPPYEIGGTLHIVINNQVGFTTNYIDARSSTYCTDVAKVTNSPVFHVNGDDVEAVVSACRLAVEFRQKFNRDVFIDLLCYRRHGHNEGDEPRFTQPILYKIIEQHPNPLEIYVDKLTQAGSVEKSLAKDLTKKFKRLLQDRLNDVKQNPHAVSYSHMSSAWKDIRQDEDQDWNQSPETGVPEKTLRPLAEKMLELPTDKVFYDKVNRILDARKKMLNETDRLDWAMGELLAYASLLNEGHPVRMSGQDVERGTFAHRHAVMKLVDSAEKYIALNHLNDKQAKFEIYNSLLSEYAVLGFEFGYSWSSPYGLTLWEAQFGDFINGAQIIIDQYISTAEQKWRRLSGLVMLLPHGYEGQGPEHSSARIERFLETCSHNNWQLINPTTPAQIFHALRRQLHRPIRVPLVVFSPKNLLRLPEATSSFSELTSGRFRELIGDDYADPKKVSKVLVCSGKIYYDLLAQQQKDKRKDVAVVRLEQLYPLPTGQIDDLRKLYKKATRWVWVQDEPENMGAYGFILRKIREINWEVISRKESATPATGYKKQHQKQQRYIIERSFDIQADTEKKSTKVTTKA